jgi:hypothetical protein
MNRVGGGFMLPMLEPNAALAAGAMGKPTRVLPTAAARARHQIMLTRIDFAPAATTCKR